MTLSRRKLLGFLAATPAVAVAARLPAAPPAFVDPPMIAAGDPILGGNLYAGAINWVDPDS